MRQAEDGRLLRPGRPGAGRSVFPNRGNQSNGRVLALSGSLVVLLAVGVAGCGGGTARDATALRQYLAQIEPLRLSVNRLLEEADPILSAYRDNRITHREAQRRFDLLERRFAAYTEQIAAIQPRGDELSHAHDVYLHTYYLEDAYLSSLANALPSGQFDDLPHTAEQQRAAIIEWRTDLTVLAARARVRLPADLQVAGRGEIAPSPTEDEGATTGS